jgi:hypothetical protein
MEYMLLTIIRAIGGSARGGAIVAKAGDVLASSQRIAGGRFGVARSAKISV